MELKSTEPRSWSKIFVFLTTDCNSPTTRKILLDGFTIQEHDRAMAPNWPKKTLFGALIELTSVSEQTLIV
uniref:Uncharacterized protein n=1 Tax=Romanomermis culicivorax TaxID=13658 RepID=A0A915KHE0_ROMCU